MIVGTVLLIFLAFVWLYFLWSRRKLYMCALKMKGPWGYPLIGILHKMYKLEEFLHIMPKFAKEYNTRTYFTWIGPFPMIYTIDPNVAEIVLQSPDCLNKSKVYEVMNDAIGNGLITSKTPKWTKHRKLLNPCFGYKVLLEKVPEFNNFARDLCGQLDTFVGCGEVDIKELSLKMGLKASIALTMGANVEEDSGSKLVKSFESIFGLIINRMIRPWFRSMTIYSWTSSYKPFIEARTAIRNSIQDLINTKLKPFNNPNPNDNILDKEKASNLFIDQAIRIHQQNEFTIADIVDEVTLMVMAAYETTANTLYSTLMFLAMNPQIQERVFDEVSTLFYDKEFDVTYNDLKRLVYLEMCINETLRITPPGPIISRVCGKDLRISEDITIPEGGEIYIDIFNIHRDEDIWGPTAKTYNPDHFLPSNLQDKHNCAFLPFSRGKRNCVGWQHATIFLKVMLAQILRNYEFSTTFRFEDIKFLPLVSLKYGITPCLEVNRR